MSDRTIAIVLAKIDTRAVRRQIINRYQIHAKTTGRVLFGQKLKIGRRPSVIVSV